MKKTKQNWLLLIIVITIMVKTVQVSATPIPIVVPVKSPSKEELKIEKEEYTKQYDGVYKLGDNPLVIEVTDDDYTKFYKLFKETRVLKESQIYKQTIDDILRTDKILVYDLRVLRGYEVSKAELNKLLENFKLKPNTDQQIDIVEIRKGNKTQILNFQKILVKSKNLNLITLDVPEYRMESVEKAIKTVEEERKIPLKNDKLFIYLNGETHNITNTELVKIAKEIDTRQALCLNEKITDLENTSDAYNTYLITLLVLLFITVIFP